MIIEYELRVNEENDKSRMKKDACALFTHVIMLWNAFWKKLNDLIGITSDWIQIMLHLATMNVNHKSTIVQPILTGKNWSSKFSCVVMMCVFLILFLDLYQITMAYSFWKNGQKDHIACYDLYFRKNPFQGEFTVFAGLTDCLYLLENFKFTESGFNLNSCLNCLFLHHHINWSNFWLWCLFSDTQYLKKILPHDVDPKFFHYLLSLSAKDVELYSVPEGSVVFPKVPLIIVQAPLPVAQLLETILLNLVNFAR